MCVWPRRGARKTASSPPKVYAPATGKTCAPAGSTGAATGRRRRFRFLRTCFREEGTGVPTAAPPPSATTPLPSGTATPPPESAKAVPEREIAASAAAQTRRVRRGRTVGPASARQRTSLVLGAKSLLRLLQSFELERRIP